jgi:hypothetical protein
MKIFILQNFDFQISARIESPPSKIFQIKIFIPKIHKIIYFIF